jgi:hypothetical protein
MRAVAGKCGGGEKLFLPLYLSARRSDLYDNPLYYNRLQVNQFSEIYRKTL